VLLLLPVLLFFAMGDMVVDVDVVVVVVRCCDTGGGGFGGERPPITNITKY
jgi:hypothetical protein